MKQVAMIETLRACHGSASAVVVSAGTPSARGLSAVRLARERPDIRTCLRRGTLL